MNIEVFLLIIKTNMSTEIPKEERATEFSNNN